MLETSVVSFISSVVVRFRDWMLDFMLLIRSCVKSSVCGACISSSAVLSW